jgi:hypothetical protein
MCAASFACLENANDSSVMKSSRIAGSGFVAWHPAFRAVSALALAGSMLAGAPSSLSAATVTTIAGGPTNSPPYTAASGAGFRDGPGIGTHATGAQFNLPAGVATDPAGRFLFIADSANGAIRKMDLTSGQVTTMTFPDVTLTGLTPVDVAVDGATNLYVLTQGDGLVRKYDVNVNALGTVNAAALTTPTALALNGSTNIFVSQANGAIVRINHPTNTTSTVFAAAGSFLTPGGIEVLDSGAVVVSDTGSHVIRYLNSAGAVTNTIGLAGTAGTNNGPAAIARFRTPHHLAKAGNNVVIVADTGNHQVRRIDAAGNVSGLYGVDSNVWFTLDPIFIPGWVDGNGPNEAEPRAESRLPEGLVVDGSGNVYSSEQFYHIIRKTTATGLTGPGGTFDSGSGSNVVLNPPSLTISPSSGYFPSGTAVTVTSSSDSVFFTTDGSVPTTNSTPVVMAGGVGTIQWFNSTNDLTGLRVAAFASSGTNTASTNIVGVASTTNVVGVPGDLLAGVGSTIYVPVVINLRTNDTLRSIGFRAEVVPGAGAPPIVASLNVVSLGTNDFVRLTGVSSDGSAVNLQVSPYTIGTTRGVAVSSLSPTNFLVNRFGVVALLEVGIPAGTAVGNTYTVSILQASGTSDGSQTVLPLGEGASRTITLSTLSYIVGDTSPGRWYNAGDFGNGDLDNSDVNNVFLASLGLRVPFAASDAFNAMDVFPEIAGNVLMGDGDITMNDWITVLNRSLRLDTANFRRGRNAAGARTNSTTTLPARLAASTAAPGNVWYRHGSLQAASVGGAVPGAMVTVPVSLRVPADAALDGVQFGVLVTPADGAPALTQAIQLLAADNTSIQPFAEGAFGLGTAAFAKLSRYGSGSNFLANLRLRVPASAQAGHTYTVSFFRPYGTIGGPGNLVEPTLENVSAVVRVLQDAPPAVVQVSDQWLNSFFGGAGSPDAALGADPDGDGLANWEEFMAGTDPTSAGSRLRLEAPQARLNGGQAETVLRLLTAPGKTYVLESTTDLAGPWTVVATFTGDGNVRELIQTNGLDAAAFYRVRLLP